MDTKMVNIKVNGNEYQAPDGMTILDACASAGIKIPTLCYLEGVSRNASCGVCLVEVKGARTLVRSCSTCIREGIEIATNSPRIREARRTNVELLLANHPKDCLSCLRNQNCELQEISAELGVKDDVFVRTRPVEELDLTSPSIIRDPNKCILCGRCVAVCATVQTVYAIDFTRRGNKSKVSTYMDKGLGNVACTNCGQCALVCPTGAIVERDDTDKVFEEILNPDKVVIVQTAPAIRVGIGEAMGMGHGALVTGQMVAGLRRLGFNKVFDTQFTADLTIMEEGHELIKRLTKGGVLPMITSCSPGWIKFIEHFFPNSLDHLSTCKSPQQMFGAVAKTYYAAKTGIDPRKMVVVSIMPCTAKKYEAKRPEMMSAFAYWKEKKSWSDDDAFYDVDYVLTTRELARMFKESGIQFSSLPSEEFDNPLGESTGAAVIFGTTGGVMEAALRTAYEVVTGSSLPNINFTAVRGMEGIKEAEVDMSGTKIRVAVAHTLKNARRLLDQIEKGESPYAFIEVMTCPGGCIGGGGQPIPTSLEIRKKRAASIYAEDEGKPIRKSHENPEIGTIYREFLKEPLGHISHSLLHTSYKKRGLLTWKSNGEIKKELVLS
ncbi:MAG TPA: NADH-dependent [FeFe] hydrogenase, group A6 [Candidatus Acidoferrales bacterium]|nr:NADH-dependent [FeFe] hydrogenase, group A6 [Candidatus Acidoferrales bacterium]